MTRDRKMLSLNVYGCIFKTCIYYFPTFLSSSKNYSKSFDTLNGIILINDNSTLTKFMGFTKSYMPSIHIHTKN